VQARPYKSSRELVSCKLSARQIKAVHGILILFLETNSGPVSLD